VARLAVDGLRRVDFSTLAPIDLHNGKSIQATDLSQRIAHVDVLRIGSIEQLPEATLLRNVVFRRILTFPY
jgi:hypothetical protein